MDKYKSVLEMKAMKLELKEKELEMEEKQMHAEHRVKELEAQNAKLLAASSGSPFAARGVTKQALFNDYRNEGVENPALVGERFRDAFGNAQRVYVRFQNFIFDLPVVHVWTLTLQNQVRLP